MNGEKWPSGRRKSCDVDLFGSAERVFGFDGDGKFSYVARTYEGAPSVCAALYPAAADGDFFTYDGTVLKRCKNGVGMVCTDFSAAPSHAVGTYGGVTCDLFFGGGVLYADSGSSGSRAELEISGKPEDAYRHMQILIDGGKLLFSAPYDPTEYSVTAGGAEIATYGGAGRVFAVKEIRGRLYAFCERGAWLCDYDGNDENTSLSFAARDAERIVEGSLQKCGERAVFLTTSGRLYGFDGDADVLADDVWEGGSVLSSCENGLYLLAQGSGIFVYDAETNGCARIDCGREVTALGGRYFFAGKTQCVRRVRGGGLVVTKPCGFGTSAPKKLCKVYYRGTGPMTLCIRTERGEKTFSFSGEGCVFPAMSGRAFVFAANCPEGTVPEKLTAVYAETGVK